MKNLHRVAVQCTALKAAPQYLPAFEELTFQDFKYMSRPDS